MFDTFGCSSAVTSVEELQSESDLFKVDSAKKTH
jgi:hypothetical protein